MKDISFFEYGGFELNGEEDYSLSSLPMTEDQKKYLCSLSETLLQNKRIFSIDQKTIKANSIVGSISFENVRVEIMPKILKYNSGNRSDIIRNLMFMLSYTNQLDVSDANINSMSHDYDSFIEAYISIFANRLLKHLRMYGSPKSYIEKEENLNTLKGRVIFSKQSSLNCFDQSKVFCEFSEFSENNKLSKAFKFVAWSLSKLTKNSSSLTVLGRCYGILDGVNSEYISPNDLNFVQVGKRDNNFLALINLTKMFLQKMRPDFSGNKSVKVFSLLFDMNELFEEFIYQILKRNSSRLEIEVSAQKKKRLVSEERDFLVQSHWSPKYLFDTFTDIAIIPKIGRSFIIDTKYKIVSTSKSHYGISNQDAYQVLAYRQIHSTQNGSPAVALIYPLSDFKMKKEFKITSSDTTFFAWTVDISRNLQNELHKVLDELQELIGIAIKSNS